MNKLNVLILSGLSSPFHESHKSSYYSVNEEAINRGYSSRIIHHPGQIDEKGNTDGVLCLSSSIENLTKHIIELEEKQQKYRLIGFSYGCYVVSATLGRLSELKGLYHYGCLGKFL
jgi:surfactin synthase thioesterase subunit